DRYGYVSRITLVSGRRWFSRRSSRSAVRSEVTPLRPLLPASTRSLQPPGSRQPSAKHCFTMSTKSMSSPPRVRSTRSASLPTCSVWDGTERVQVAETDRPEPFGVPMVPGSSGSLLHSLSSADSVADLLEPAATATVLLNVCPLRTCLVVAPLHAMLSRV